MHPGRDSHDGGMTGMEAVTTAENYRRFARFEAAGRSPAYEVLAEAVSEDTLVLAFLENLPAMKRQPNLLFAAARHLLGRPADPSSLHQLVASRGDDLGELMLARRTQTNEPARCAVLLPALAQVPEPLALLEVGAAAGLTLLPDVYSYDYGGHRVTGTDGGAPTLPCRPVGDVPLPRRSPEVVWRAGIDLSPLDVGSDDDVAWLSCLIWPGEDEREERLRAAVESARRQPPRVVRGDLLDDLAPVAAYAPAGATLVVYHTAVLAYVDEAKRRDFATAVRALGAVWLSNEGDRVLSCMGIERDDPSATLLVRDGREVLARSDPHGRWTEWFAPEAGRDRPCPR